MIADLWALAVAHPTLAGMLFAIVLLVAVLCVFATVGLRRLSPDTLSDISEIQALKPEHQAKHSASAPLPWNRSGGNWWPIP
jgi:hypothetical protein